MKKRIAIALMAFWAPILSAKELRWTQFGVRPLGMGNAFVAVADDFNALFYNPAGLARLPTWHLETINPAVETSTQTISLVKDVFKLAAGKAGDITSVINILKGNTGKLLGGSLSLTPHFVMPHFGLGIGTQSSFIMNVHRDINIEIALTIVRLVAPIAYAFDVIKDVLSVGASLKPVMTMGVAGDFDIGFLGAFSNPSELSNKFSAGYGVGADVGVLFTPIKTMSPTIGLSVMDVGGTTFTPMKLATGGVAPTTPEERSAAINAGFSFKPYNTDVNYLLLAADAHMINQPIHYSHKFNLGTEFGFTSILKLQAGLKEGYWTAGMQFDVGLLKLRVASYGVDHGAVVGMQKNAAERRIVMQLKLLL